MVKKFWLVSAGLLAAVGSSSVALAQQGDGNWMVRIRAVDIRPVEKWSDAGVLGLGSSDVYVRDKTIPEVDFTYFITKNIAAELILTYPQKLTVTSKTIGDLGTFKALPPTLTLQYHFAPDATVRPYVGAGINYTIFSGKSVNRVAPLDIDSSSFGGALQVGVDWKVGANSYVNFDVKKVYMDTDVRLATTGARIGKATVDPVLIGIGYGFRF